MGKKIALSVMCLLMVLLIVSNVWFIQKANEPDLEIVIGAIREGESGLGYDFLGAEPLAQDDMHTIVLALIQATAAEESQIPETSPDGVMLMEGKYNSAYFIRVWITDGVVVSALGNDEQPDYKTIPAGWQDAFVQIVEREIALRG